MSPFLAKVTQVIVNPTIKLFFAAAVLLFLWGVFKYVKGADDENERTKGSQHMIYGVLGMFIMVAVFGIMKFVLSSVGIEGNELPEILR